MMVLLVQKPNALRAVCNYTTDHMSLSHQGGTVNKLV